MSEPSRDARPFLAYHLRRRGDAADARNGADLHTLARWVENLPKGDPRMATIEATDALGYSDGSFQGGEEAETLITRYEAGDANARERWLDEFVQAVRRHWE